MALLAGFVVAYPIYWWLVAKGLKHGMSTTGEWSPNHDLGKAAMAHSGPNTHPNASTEGIALMVVLSIIAFGLACKVVGVVRANMEMQPLSLD